MSRLKKTIVVVMLFSILLGITACSFSSASTALKCVKSINSYCVSNYLSHYSVYVMHYTDKEKISLPPDFKAVAPDNGYIIYSGEASSKIKSNWTTTKEGSVWFFDNNATQIMRCDYYTYKKAFLQLEQYNLGNTWLSEEDKMDSNRWYRCLLP